MKKIGRNHDALVYKKALISEHRQICIFQDINCFADERASREGENERHCCHGCLFILIVVFVYKLKKKIINY